jgi:hypothetical protein
VKVATFMALESLALGVEGKASPWKVLRELPDRYGPLRSTDFDDLIKRADAQRAALERERIAVGRLAFGGVAT